MVVEAVQAGPLARQVEAQGAVEQIQRMVLERQVRDLTEVTGQAHSLEQEVVVLLKLV